MAEILNLKHARKQRERDAKLQDAEANRRQFGRTKAQRKLAEHERTKAERDHKGRKLD